MPPARRPRAGPGPPALLALSVVLRAAGPQPPGAAPGSPRLEGPESPCSLRVPVRHGRAPTPGRPAYKQPCYSLTTQRTDIQVFSSGCQYFPLFKAERARPVCLATDEFGCLLTTTLGPRAGSVPGKGKGWRGTETAAI